MRASETGDANPGRKRRAEGWPTYDGQKQRLRISEDDAAAGAGHRSDGGAFDPVMTRRHVARFAGASMWAPGMNDERSMDRCPKDGKVGRGGIVGWDEDVAEAWALIA